MIVLVAVVAYVLTSEISKTVRSAPRSLRACPYIKEIEEETFKIEENFPFVATVYYYTEEILDRLRQF
jgi:hypothetical protein